MGQLLEAGAYPASFFVPALGGGSAHIENISGLMLISVKAVPLVPCLSHTPISKNYLNTYII